MIESLSTITEKPTLLLMVKPFSPVEKTRKREIIDERYIRLFDNVEAGTIIARIYPPRNYYKTFSGISSNNPFWFNLDTTIDESLEIISPQNSELFATIIAKNSGMLIQGSDELKIVSNYKIAGSVDFYSGDIDFCGSLEITGDIKKGFLVQAWNCINIGGDVRGRVQSKYGAVNVRNSIIGEIVQIKASPYIPAAALSQLFSQCESQVSAASDISANNIENTTIETTGNVFVNKDIRSSIIRASGTVKIGGTVSGGKVFTAANLQAQNIGNTRNINTLINLCSPIQSSTKFADLTNDLANYEQALQLSQLYLGPFVNDPQRLLLLDDKHRQKMEELISHSLEIKSKKTETEKQLNDLLANSEPAAFYRVNFLSAFYPGATVQFENNKYTTDTMIQGPKTLEFSVKTNRFTLRSFIPIE